MDHSKIAEQERRTFVLLRSHVERCLQDVGGRSELHLDSDGDYPFRHGTAMGWVSLLDGPVFGVRVFAHAAYELRTSAKLLKEVNELNARSRWTKIAFEHGVVWVSMEMHWGAVDRLALAHAVNTVGQVAHEIGSLVATVYGGSTPFSPEVEAQDQDATEEAA